jgi:GNAT superfamily N-acetyltransferase
MNAGEVDAVVALHLAAFPGFFLSLLGRRFLQLLYTGFMVQPSGVCLVARDGSAILGFAAGTTDPKAFFSALLRRQAITFALAAVPGLLRNPAFVARKCIGALTYRGEEPKRLSGAALLSSLAVSPAAQGRGVGRSLARAFAAEARARGADAVYLLTDEKENERTNRFYVQCGFALLDTFARPGRRIMNRWVLPLGGGA